MTQKRRRRLIPLFAALLVVAAIGGALNREDAGLPGGLPGVPTPPGAKTDRERTPLPDPFAYDPDRRKEFEERAAAGTSHALYARSPGGALATAQRVAQWRPQVEAAAKEAGVDPDRLEALVFLESAGRSDAIASDTEGAVGLTQILAETGQNLLGMQIDVDRSRHYSRRIRRELLRAHLNKVRELQRARAKVDQRFDPAQALQATARYLTMAKERFRREDMAFVSYHMGMGNLESVLRAYGADDDVPYTQVYFDSSPVRHSAAYAKLASFGDDSSNYWWKLGAAERIMELSRKDTGKLAALQAAQTAKNSAEEVLHPPGSTQRYRTPADAAGGVGRRRRGRLPPRRARDRAARGPADGGARPAALALPRPPARGARHRALHRRAGAVAVRPGAAGGHLDRARRRVPEAARGPEPRGDPQLLAPHHRLGVRHRPRVPLEGACAGVPVRARPPAGARRDRLGARARRDPRHGRAGGEGPAPPARPGTTRGMTDAIRTPDPILEGLPDYPYEPHYRTVDGLRLAHVDEGDGRPVVMWHGEPTWGYLWRHVLPPVRDAGHRVILPDLAGFGRSDKPVDRDWYSYDRHAAMAATLLEDLDVRDATFVVHDWGGPIGLRLAVEHPDRVARLVIMDTGLFTGEQPMSDAWHAFHAFVERTEDLPVGMLVRRGCHRDPGDEVAAAYDAPFPNAAAKAGARAFPGLIPQSPDAPGAAEGKRVLEALRGDERPC